MTLRPIATCVPAVAEEAQERLARAQAPVLVAHRGALLEHHDLVPRLGQHERRRGARGAAADDHEVRGVVVIAPRPPAIGPRPSRARTVGLRAPAHERDGLEQVEALAQEVHPRARPPREVADARAAGDSASAGSGMPTKSTRQPGDRPHDRRAGRPPPGTGTRRRYSVEERGDGEGATSSGSPSTSASDDGDAPLRARPEAHHAPARGRGSTGARARRPRAASTRRRRAGLDGAGDDRGDLLGGLPPGMVRESAPPPSAFLPKSV